MNHTIEFLYTQQEVINIIDVPFHCKNLSAISPLASQISSCFDAHEMWPDDDRDRLLMVEKKYVGESQSKKLIS
jgi:hypothetical protein